VQWGSSLQNLVRDRDGTTAHDCMQSKVKKVQLSSTTECSSYRGSSYIVLSLSRGQEQADESKHAGSRQQAGGRAGVRLLHTHELLW
jgi:hypothetical protein